MQNLNFSSLVASVTSLVLKSLMRLVCTPLDGASPYTQEETGLCMHIVSYPFIFYFILTEHNLRHVDFVDLFKESTFNFVNFL